MLGALDLDPLCRRLGEGRYGAGRREAGPRILLQALIAGWVYDLHSIAELRRELLRNGSLRLLVGIPSAARIPSEDAFGRLIARLAAPDDLVAALFQRTVTRLRRRATELGQQVAIDATAIDAGSEGNRALPADPDARWSQRGFSAKGRAGWWFGYQLHLAVDTQAELPLACTVTPANVADSTQVAPLLDAVAAQQPAGHLQAVMADAAYDGTDLYQDTWGAAPCRFSTSTTGAGRRRRATPPTGAPSAGAASGCAIGAGTGSTPSTGGAPAAAAPGAASGAGASTRTSVSTRRCPATPPSGPASTPSAPSSSG